MPIFLIKTSFPENLKSFGNLTAWLRPFMNIFAICIIVFFVLGLIMDGHLYKFGVDTGWRSILAILSSMAAGIPYFIALIFGLGSGNPGSVLEPYANYFLLAAGMLNILIALDAMDIAAGRKE